MITEDRAIEVLKRGQIDFFPLTVNVVEAHPRGGEKATPLEIEVRWKSKVCRFVVQYKWRSTPKLFNEAVQQGKSIQSFGKTAMIVMPYLSEEKMRILVEHDLNGLDLCGNCVICVDDVFMIFKTGRPNLYPESQGIQNPFVGKSSFVPRVLLLHSRYGSVSEIQEEVRARRGDLALGTVSKVLHVLDEQVLIHKHKSSVCVLQPEEILDRLAKEYRKPKVEISIRGKITVEKISTFVEKIQASGTEGNYALFWFGHLNPYALMGRENDLFLYAKNIDIVDILEIDTHTRFPNIEVQISRDPLLYFDSRTWLNGATFMSPIQTYLALMMGDKRDQETALQVRKYIFNELSKQSESSKDGDEVS